MTFADLGLSNDATADERRQAYRKASLRWHPDKFTQAFGQLLRVSEREAVMQRVKTTSQALNALYAGL